MLLKNITDFENLKLAQKIYIVNEHINGYYYAGISPIASPSGEKSHIMLIDSNNISTMSTLYLPRLGNRICTTDYNEAKRFMWKFLLLKMQSIKEIYLKDWTEEDWREFNIESILESK